MTLGHLDIRFDSLQAEAGGRYLIRFQGVGRCLSVILFLLSGSWGLCAEVASDPAAEIGSPSQDASSPPQPPVGRADEWRQRRLQKGRQADPPQQSGLEKSLLRLESQTFQEVLSIRYKDFYPKFGSLSHGSGFSPGLRYFKENLGGSGLSIETTGAFSFSGYKLGTFQFGKFRKVAPHLFLAPNEFETPFKFDEEREKTSNYFLYADTRYRYFPEEVFYGTGPDSTLAGESDFLMEDGAYDIVGGYQFGRFGTVARAGYLQTNVNEGSNEGFPGGQEPFADASLAGLTRQPDFLRLSAAVFFDYRDVQGNPHQGGVFALSFSRYDDRGGSEFEFNRFSFDTRQYVPLGSKQRVLAVRLFASVDDADPGSQVPFYLQRTLGGNATLRGFPEFRFRDSKLLYFSAEYRWETWPAVELVVFYDAGRVFPESQDLDFEHFEKSIGGGIRFKTSKRTVVRLEVGRSDEDTRIHFQFGPSF